MTRIPLHWASTTRKRMIKRWEERNFTNQSDNDPTGSLVGSAGSKSSDDGP